MRFKSTVQKMSFAFATIAMVSAFAPDCASAQSGLQPPGVTVSESARKPLIGISLDISDNGKEASVPTYYYQAIEKSGGLPILLPPMPKDDLLVLLAKLDGLVLIGGADYPPDVYGDKIESKTRVMAQARADFDLMLAKTALTDSRMPILGICAGCQLLNITQGGSLVQDIPSKFPQSKVVHGGPYDGKSGPRMHEVSFVKDSLLGKLYANAPLPVPTSHHQCLNNVGTGLKVVATTADGLPEAIEKEGTRFIVGVQWHPERDYENNKALFAEFMKNASENKTLNLTHN